MIASSAGTTPFGRRSLTLAHVASQLVARQRPSEAAAHKWSVFRAICAAKARLGLSERALAVLEALLSFHPETVLTGEDLIVFPSNEQLCLRAHGMAPATLRRHLAALVEAGVILRRDSPNGKRYARKDKDGAIAKAFGFDLSPLVARAGEFEALAEEIRAEERALRYAKERITLARRDLVKMIAAGIEEKAPLPPGSGRPVSWEELHARYRRLIERIPRTAGLAELERNGDELADLAAFALKALEAQVKNTNSSANESQTERHIHDSKPNTTIELESPSEKGEAAASSEPARPSSKMGDMAFPLGLVLRACPDIGDYTRGKIADWRDLAAAASVARAALGVSPSAWEAAQLAMGERSAAIAVAAILQRGAAISSAGGYLRELTRKAQANEFSIGPMLMALIGARNREKRRA
jgi:replication initiation protein RepC